MRRYFISGGTGMIGRELCRQLLVKPDTESVTCLTRGKRPTASLLSHPNLRYWIGDVTDCALPAEDFTDLIHGANDANDLLQPDQDRYYYTIVEGTNRVLKWAMTRSIERRLILSSGAVARDTIYGRAKRQCERIANDYGNCKIARIFSVLGEEMPLNGQFAAGKFIHMALNEGKVHVYGGSSLRSYLHVEDAARWLIQILTHAPTGRCIDVCGDIFSTITIMELAEMVSEVFNVDLERTTGPDREDHYIPSYGHAAVEHDLKQTITARQALERIRDYYADLRYPHLESQRKT